MHPSNVTDSQLFYLLIVAWGQPFHPGSKCYKPVKYSPTVYCVYFVIFFLILKFSDSSGFIPHGTSATDE